MTIYDSQLKSTIRLYYDAKERSLRVEMVSVSPEARHPLRQGWSYNIATAVASEWFNMDASALVPPQKKN